VTILIPILIVIAVLVLVGVVLAMRRRPVKPYTAAPLEPPPGPSVPEPPPMIDLESALAKVTDRSGRPIRDRIDAEAGIVDGLRVPDDTGPLLRRALDNVVHPPTEQASGDDAGAATEAADHDDGQGSGS
jgi:hypothetical protein